MGFGHYTAYAKNPKDGNWYDFDDSHVSLVRDSSGIITEAAYNLFYKRKDFAFDEEPNFDLLKHSWDFEEFKGEVAQYAVPEKKVETKEEKTNESSTINQVESTDDIMEDDS